MKTTAEVIEAMKIEIADLVKSGTVPSTVRDFQSLHDYVDANMLGGTEEIFAEIVTESTTDAEHSAKLDKVQAIVGPAQDAVNEWIKSGHRA